LTGTKERKERVIRDWHTTNEQLVRDLVGLGRHVAEVLTTTPGDPCADEQARRSLAEKYRCILAAITDGYFEVDLSGNLTFCNKALCEIGGYPMEGVIGSNYGRYLKRDVARRVRQIFGQLVLTGEPVAEFDFEILRRDATERFVSTSASLIRDEAGRPAGFSGIVRDTTDSKEADHQLELLRFSIEHTAEATFLKGPDARFLYANKAACDSLGYTREELLGLTLRDIDKDFSPEIWRAAKSEATRGKALMFESRHCRKDGSVIPVEIKTSIMEFDGRRYACAFVRDITERKRAEEQLRCCSFRLITPAKPFSCSTGMRVSSTPMRRLAIRSAMRGKS
jgi:PAS domain S-box-containing protein